MRDALDRVGELAREALHGETSATLHAEGRERIMATAVSRRFARRPARSWLAVSLAAAAVALLAFGVFGYRRPLGYTVQGAASFEANYLGAAADKPAEVRFDDGSRIHAEPGTRLRIDESYTDGARVLLERGAATAQVTHALATRWRFVAGPFAVHVTGTKFTLKWEPVTEEVDLVLHEGSVEVESPLSAGRLAVRAGQRFRASLPKGSMHVETVPPAAAAAAAGAAGAAPAPVRDPAIDAEAAPPVAAPAAVPPSPVSKPAAGDAHDAEHASWTELVRSGRFSVVVEDARRRGIDASLAAASAKDLRALADAARYGGDSALAGKTLRTIRSRFAGGREASAAAFLLGRTQETAGDLQGADRWYTTYLAEAPSGELAADALAGRMRVAAPLRGNESARMLALEYLRLYPRGVHAAGAKKLVERE